MTEKTTRVNLTTIQSFKLGQWLEKNKNKVLGTTVKYITAEAVRELGFPISWRTVGPLCAELGVEVARKRTSTGRPTTTNRVLIVAKELRALRQELGLPESADLNSIIARQPVH